MKKVYREGMEVPCFVLLLNLRNDLVMAGYMTPAGLF